MAISPSSGTSSRQARRGVFFLDRLQLGLDDRQHARFLGQDIEQVVDASSSALYSALTLSDLQAGQLVEAQIQDGVGLRLAEGVAAVGQPRLVADEDADAARPAARVKSKASSLTLASSRVAELRMMRMNSSRLASAIR